jgi:hypothetical protein
VSNSEQTCRSPGWFNRRFGLQKQKFKYRVGLLEAKTEIPVKGVMGQGNTNSGTIRRFTNEATVVIAFGP